MSQYYYLIDTRNKTFFELGKAAWYEFQDMEAFQDLEYLTHEILTEVFYINDHEYWDNPHIRQERIEELTNNVIPKLFEYFGATPSKCLKIISDSTDDLTICRSKGYKCLGSRYVDPDGSGLAFLNRHLKEENKSRYNSVSFKDLLEWEEY